jgi:metal-dependent amidase/aminoacylase/carboxypeptidase family protein
LARLLTEQKPKIGKIFLLFQPAEEDGEGAKAIFSDPKFKPLKPDYIFAFHNLPGYPLNQIVVKNNSFTAGVKSIIIQIHGKTAHAAEPENGLNPALAIAEILQESAKLSNNDPNRDDFTLITPIHIEMGEIAYGISAGYGEVRLTIRTWDEYNMEKLTNELISCIKEAAANHNMPITYSWTHEFYANQNDDVAVSLIKEAASSLSFDFSKENFLLNGEKILDCSHKILKELCLVLAQVKKVRHFTIRIMISLMKFYQLAFNSSIKLVYKFYHENIPYFILGNQQVRVRTQPSIFKKLYW